MAGRRLGIIILALCFCCCMALGCAQASSTADAKEAINAQHDCALTIFYGCDGTSLSGLNVKLYRVADVSADFQYTLTDAFAATELVLNGIQTIGEWDVIRATLKTHIVVNPVEADAIAETDLSGQACFSALKPGLYLAEPQTVVLDSGTYFFDAALIALPGLGADGLWQYEVAVNAKPELLPPVEPEEEIQLKVVKLWKGDSGQSTRPTSIEVEIFKDGISDRTVTLSKENNWAYSWTAADDGAVWTVVERNIPSGYTLTMEEREHSFTLTNKRKGELPPDSPQTGDDSNILLYSVLMYASGFVLVLVGITGKRKRHEK